MKQEMTLKKSGDYLPLLTTSKKKLCKHVRRKKVQQQQIQMLCDQIKKKYVDLLRKTSYVVF